MEKIRWCIRRLVVSLILTVTCVAASYAQNVITGTVSDTNGEPLVGVSIVVKGTTRGQVTNIDGRYQIEAKANDILTFASVGMVSQEVKVGNRKTIDITMKEDVAALSEVVVVGYGTQKRGSITGAISTVSDKEILKAPTMSISNIIGPRIAGVAAVQSSG